MKTSHPGKRVCRTNTHRAGAGRLNQRGEMEISKRISTTVTRDRRGREGNLPLGYSRVPPAAFRAADCGGKPGESRGVHRYAYSLRMEPIVEVRKLLFVSSPGLQVDVTRVSYRSTSSLLTNYVAQVVSPPSRWIVISDKVSRKKAPQTEKADYIITRGLSILTRNTLVYNLP